MNFDNDKRSPLDRCKYCGHLRVEHWFIDDGSSRLKTECKPSNPGPKDWMRKLMGNRWCGCQKFQEPNRD